MIYLDLNTFISTRLFLASLGLTPGRGEVSPYPLEDALSARVLDSNGNELHDGDTIIVIKDLPVKGAPKPIKSGTRVKNIRLTDGDHNIDCKIDGFGSMALKSEFVKKA